MALVPSGKRRYMQAQTAPNPISEQAGQIDMSNLPAQDVDQGAAAPQEQQPIQEGETPGGDEPDVRMTVFKFLEGLGYPARRLQEFKAQFVSETGNAESGAQISMKIPDEVYGKNIPIPRAKLKELVKVIEQNHGMSFVDYKRSNQEVILNFVSADAKAQQMQQEGPGDILDKVYGTPKNSKNRRGIPTQAKTISELIKESHSRQTDILKKVLGVKI